MREKLIELICSTEYGNGSLIGNNFQKGFIEKIADYLIANGVTIATDNNVGHKWIPVSERLPKKFNNTLAVRKCGDWFSVGVECILADGKWSGDVFEKNEVTHWMPLPLLPKEGE